MKEIQVEIINKLGLHARPAAEIVKTAARFASDITLIRDDLEVNGKSIMGVMMLAAEFGSTITLRADGPDEDQALDALAAVVANKFGER
ncbi:MAG: HPr family phosphocarrier protein [Gemmatimonadota bacterium]|nr:HPr family phosphocarrier protein [Gemmatimonadaceae bacterium]MDQ3515682.1 HPr family phosphocarrier protein [Gemmatimonadota bacterium]